MLSHRRIRSGLGALLILISLECAPTDANATATDYTQGTSCTTPATAGISGSTNGGSMVQPAAGNNLVCESGTWQYPAYIFGDDTTSSDSATTCSQAGELRWNATNQLLQFCNGSQWQYVVPSGTIPAPGCGTHSANLSTQQLTSITVTGGCTVTFKVWGGGGGYGYAGLVGGGGGYATIAMSPSSSTTYYLAVGGGGSNGGAGSAGLTGFTGGAAYNANAGSGGAASGVWTTSSYSGTPLVVAGGGGGGGGGSVGYAGGAGPQTSGTAGTAGTGNGGGGGGGGYTTGGLGGSSNNPGGGGSNYAASGGTTSTGSGQTPGDSGDTNRPTNSGLGGGSGNNGYAGAIYYSW